jgi:hypothetical protein
MHGYEALAGCDVAYGSQEGEMIEVSQSVSASADRVFAVLADGWLYPLWVVGASRMRDVDPGWPAEGTKIHHSVGPAAAMISHRLLSLVRLP